MDNGAWHDWSKRRGFLLLLVGLPVLFHLLIRAPAEPVFNGDANRHVMTSVFFHDFFTDLPLSNPKGYAEDYYAQYPALGLLIWPPLFHAVSGAFMLVAGLSAWVPRTIVFMTAVISGWLIARLAKRRGFGDEGIATGVLFALLPFSFTYSRYVMLEMPTLCLCLWSIERFDAWLTTARPWPLYLAAIAASLAALTRFDAIVLLPTLLLMTIFSGRIKQLFSRHTVFATIVAGILTAPTYFLIWKEMGDLHVRQATESVSGTAGQLLAPGAWSFYPSCLPEQAGWLITILAIVGLPFAFQTRWRSLSSLFAALWLGTYVSFTPLAELVSRHSIYWLPAISWFAIVGILSATEAILRLMSTPDCLGRRSYMSKAVAVTLCLGTAGITLFSVPHRHARGYRDAAEVAFELTEPEQTVFLDAWWEGNFIYQFRCLDCKRTRSVIRGNQLLYDFTSIPEIDLTAYVETDEDMLQTIAKADPSCIVFEDPQPFGEIPMAKQLRQLVVGHPEIFSEVKRIPVELSFPGARNFSLCVFDVDQDKLNDLLQNSELTEAATEHLDTATVLASE